MGAGVCVEWGPAGEADVTYVSKSRTYLYFSMICLYPWEPHVYVYGSMGSVVYDPLQTLADTHFDHMGLLQYPFEKS